MLGYKKGNKKLLTGQIPLHYPGDRVYLDGDPTKSVQDKCARKSDLTNLDLTGTTNTTGSTIASGTYFYLNGVFVRAKTAIASGATFTEGTNYEVVTVGDRLNNLFTIKEYIIASTNLSQLSYFGATAYLGQLTTETATYGTIISATARDTSNYPCICQVKSDNNLNVIGTANRDFIVRVVYSK